VCSSDLLAAVRDSNPEVSPLEDSQAEFIFEASNPAADRRCVSAKRVCSLGKVSSLGDSHQITQIDYIHDDNAFAVAPSKPNSVTRTAE
jgi:hypothetical protein